MLSPSLTSEITNASNAVLIVAELAVLCAVMAKLWSGHKTLSPTTKRGLIAWAELSTGWLIHRTWWYLAIHTAPHNGTYAAWAIDYRWLLVIPAFLVAMGAARIVSLVAGYEGAAYYAVLSTLTVGAFFGELVLTGIPLTAIVFGGAIAALIGFHAGTFKPPPDPCEGCEFNKDDD